MYYILSLSCSAEYWKESLLISQYLLYLPSNSPPLTHTLTHLHTADMNTSRHLSSADAERVESRLKKIQLQQLYAKQLSDDAAAEQAESRLRRNEDFKLFSGDASALNAPSTSTSSGRISNSGNASRRISSARIDPRSASEITNSSGIESKGVHGSIKALQLEYYQQLQDDENIRAQHHADPQTNRRASLYRTRDQKEQIDARGWSREDRSIPQSISSPLVGGGRDATSGSGYGLDDGRGRYQDQVQDPGYTGYGSAKAMQRNMIEGDVNSTRLSQGQREEQRQGDLDEFYSRTPYSIGESIRVKDSYSTQRDSDHGRSSYSSGGNNSNSNNNNNSSRSVIDSRQRGSYSQPMNQDRDIVQGRYEQGGGDDRYQERMPNMREDSEDQYRYTDSELRVNQIRERDDDYKRHMDQIRVREEESRYQEKEALQRSGRLGQSSSAYEPSRGAPSHMRLSDSRIRSEDPPVQMNSGHRSHDYGGDRDRERDMGRDRDREEYPSGQVRNYERTSTVDDASMHDSYSPSNNHHPQRTREVNSSRLSDQCNRQQMNYPVLDGNSSRYAGSGSGHSPGTGTGSGTGYDRDGRGDGECLST